MLFKFVKIADFGDFFIEETNGHAKARPYDFFCINTRMKRNREPGIRW